MKSILVLSRLYASSEEPAKWWPNFEKNTYYVAGFSLAAGLLIGCLIWRNTTTDWKQQIIEKKADPIA